MDQTIGEHTILKSPSLEISATSLGFPTFSNDNAVAVAAASTCW